jgi:hypothetical protein
MRTRTSGGVGGVRRGEPAAPTRFRSVLSVVDEAAQRRIPDGYSLAREQLVHAHQAQRRIPS